MPVVTVIIPCYNAETHISRCFEALKEQTYTDFDVVFIDDCSSDNTLKVLEKFSKDSTLNIKILRNEKNSGPAFSRNRGIAAADGKYIAFCDSDDWYDKEYLACMVNAANENESDMVLCNSNKVLPKGKIIRTETFCGQGKKLNTKSALLLGIDSLCAIMVKREIILHIPQPDLRNGEDMAVIPLLILASRKFNVVEKPIYNYFCRPGSLSLSANEKVTESLIQSFSFIYKNRDPEFEKEIEFIGIKNVIYGVILNHYKCSKDNRKANEILKNFESVYPNCYSNEYIHTLPIYKRAFVFCAKKRMYFVLRLLSLIHKRIFNVG